MKKKMIFSFIIFLFLFNILAIGASALLIPETVKETLKWIFMETKEVYIYRTLLWILLFAIFFFGAKHTAFRESPRIGGTIAAVLALIGSILAPEELLMVVFTVYGFLTPILLIGIPIAGILYIAHGAPDTTFGYGLRAAIFAVACYLFSVIDTTIKKIPNMPEAIGGIKLTDITEIAIFVFLILMVWNFIKVFTRHGEVPQIGAGEGVKKGYDWLKNLKEKRGEEQRERNIIKSELEGVTKKDIKDTRDIIKNLESIESAIDKAEKYGMGKNILDEINKNIKIIAAKQHPYETRIAEIIRILENWERDVYKKLEEAAPSLGGKGSPVYNQVKGDIEKAILAERKKYRIEKDEIENLNKAIITYKQQFNMLLKEVIFCLQSNRIAEAKAWIRKAIKSETEALALEKRILKYEKILDRLTRKEIKYMKKTSKKARKSKK